LIDSLNAAYEDGKLRTSLSRVLPKSLSQQLQVFGQIHPVQNIFVLYAALAVWSRVHGLVSLEIGNQFSPFTEDIQAIYQLQIDQIIEETLIP